MRVEWIDRWRGILIALVVLGHVVGAGYHVATGTTQAAVQLVYKVVYAFHMPAFFLLAGMTWKDKGLGFIPYLKSKAFRLLVPYLFFGVFSAGLYVIMKGQLGSIFANTTTHAYDAKGMEPIWQPFVSILHGGGWPNGTGFQCNSVLWFLPCFFSVEVLFYWLRRVPGKSVFWIGIGLAGVILDYLLYSKYCGLPMGLDLVPRYLIFFIVGHLCASVLRVGDAVPRDWWKCGGILLSLTLFTVICYWLPDMYVVRRKIPWLPVYFALALAGAAISAYCAILLDFKWLVRIGQMSLGIMLLHKFIVIALENRLPWIRKLFADGGWEALVAVILVSGISLVLSYLACCLMKKYMPLLIGQK